MVTNSFQKHSNANDGLNQNNNNNNNHHHQNIENLEYTPDENCISRFYDGATVFITGGTGFVGKALIEKLLRSCDGVKCIYILIRPKRGLDAQQRFNELTKSSVFNRIREKKPEYLNKIQFICGDLTQVNLGLSEMDCHDLTNTVNVVFHSAATVSFIENLKDAVNMNTLGTLRVVNFCKGIRNLKSFVHVSTAYSNADKKTIDEIVYPAPYDPNTIIQCAEHLPLDTLNVLTKTIMGKHPNTYTLTKAMAEEIVAQNWNALPCTIVRPSIVTGAWREPVPGWIDNLSGVTGIIVESGRGTIRSIVCQDDLVVDLIPVDVVVNTLIAAAWQAATDRGSGIRVYNCTSGSSCPLRWRRLGQYMEKYARLYPSKYVTWYPNLSFTTNRIVHCFYHVVCHVLPAFVLDIMLYCTRNKPIMMKICNKITRMAKNGEFFALHEWKFGTNSLESLRDRVNSAADAADFSLDMSDKSDFDWDSYMKVYMLGIREFILKDDHSSLNGAKAKLNRLFWVQKLLQASSLYCVYKLLVR